MSNIYAPPQSSIRQNPSSDEITDTMIAHLQTARLWAKFMGIAYFTMIGIVILMSFFLIPYFLNKKPSLGLLPLLLFTVICYLFFMIAKYLMNYAKAIKNLHETNDIKYMEESQIQFGKYCRNFVLLLVFSASMPFIIPSAVIAGH